MVGKTLARAMPLVALMACVDSGVYDSPCVGDFNHLLRCGRETGGADPSPTDRADQAVFGCRETCELFFECGMLWNDDLDSCVRDCQDSNLPQSFFDCLAEHGCNFEICFAESR